MSVATPDTNGLDPGWHLLPLAELGTWCGGGTPSKQHAEFWLGGDIPWVSPKDMKRRILIATQDCITATAVEQSAAKRFPANSIGLVVRSGILEHTLPVALIPFEATANQDMRILTVKQDLDPMWALHALATFAEDIRRSCQKDGTTVASIEVPQMMQYKIPVPPMEEQKRIVLQLDRQLGSIDSVERTLRATLDRARLLRIAVSRDVLSGRRDANV
jgi:type I restriction enzyme S subunit